MNTKLIVSILVLVGGLLAASSALPSSNWSIVGIADGEPDLIGTVITPDIPINCTSSPSFCEVSGTLTFAAGALGGPGTTFDLASDPATVTVSISASPPAAEDNFNLFDMTRDGYHCNGGAPFTLECEYNFENTTEFVLQLAPPSVVIGNGNVLITGQFLANGQPVYPEPKRYAIGDRGPANGWVFYVTDDGSNGLEAAPADQADGEWGCYGTAIAGADGLAIGTGAQNTGNIITWCMEPGIAARIADNYSVNSYFDWYLPSKDELNLIYANLHNQPTPLGGFASVYYWSSSEDNASNAWLQKFHNGDQSDYSKDYTYRVRAVRAF